MKRTKSSALALALTGIVIFVVVALASWSSYVAGIQSSACERSAYELNGAMRGYERILDDGDYGGIFVAGRFDAHKLDTLTTEQLSSDLHPGMRFHITIFDRETGMSWDFGDRPSAGNHSAITTVNVKYSDNKVNVAFLETFVWQ